MIWWLSPVPPETALSGGTRKLGDLCEILKANGFKSKVISSADVATLEWFADDLFVFPEVYGDQIKTLIPKGIPRVGFVQNAYLLDYSVADPRDHPYMTTPDLVAVMTESEHSTALVRHRFPDLPCEIIRTHSSGNGRMGKGAGFCYGAWPREKRVIYFDYKNTGSWTGADVINPIFGDLELPEGWSIGRLSGRPDAEIAEVMRNAAIFVAPNRFEGMCAPTSEAAISGCVTVCWTGGGPDEYLVGRAVIAEQDNVEALRTAIVETARSIDAEPERWARDTAIWSDWFQTEYSREREMAEIIEIMERLHGR